MLHFQKRFRATIFAVTLSVPAAWAQQQPATSAGNADTQDSTGHASTDRQPLSGAEKYSVGLNGRGRSYFLPTFQILQSADTNPTNTNTSGFSNINAVTTFNGNLSLRRLSGRSQFMADYSGGGMIYDRNFGLNSSYHQVGISEQVDGRRWSLLLGDNFSYIPDSGYGFGGGFGGFGVPLAFGPGSNLGSTNSMFNLNPGIVPSQSILTGRARRFDNGVIGQVDYRASARSTVTFSGSFGLLHFLDSGYFNSKSYGFRAGYDYNLTAKDTISVMYGVNFFRYDAVANNFFGQSVQVAYGRKLTSRMAFQISGGPQINRNRFSGSGTTHFNWNLGSSLQYAFPNWNLNLSYNHYTSLGAGVFLGAYSDEVRGSASRRLSRQWSGSVDVAYAHNRATPMTTSLSTFPGFQTLSAGGSLSRPLGHYSFLSFNYSAQRQTNGSCVSGACAPTFLRHVFGVGFSFNFRPIALD